MQFAPFYIYNFYKTQEKGKKVKKKKPLSISRLMFNVLTNLTQI